MIIECPNPAPKLTVRAQKDSAGGGGAWQYFPFPGTMNHTVQSGDNMSNHPNHGPTAAMMHVGVNGAPGGPNGNSVPGGPVGPAGPQHCVQVGMGPGGGVGGGGGGGGGGAVGPGGPMGPMGPNVRCCAGCGGKIIDRFLLHAIDRYWHTACLKCSCCNATLADIGSSCFTRGGMVLCKNDYIRLFGSSGACSSCSQMIPASEFVMRAQGNVYHLKCFACVKCHNQLVPGDRFNLINGNLLCEQDCHKFLKSALAPTTTRKGKVRGQEARQSKVAKANAMQCQNIEINQGAFI